MGKRKIVCELGQGKLCPFTKWKLYARIGGEKTLEAYKVKVSYNRLFNKLKENSVTQKQFRETVGIGGTTMAKLKNNESITIDTICSICDYFRCMPDEIMEFIPEENYPEDIKAKQQAKQEVQVQIAELQAKLKTM